MFGLQDLQLDCKDYLYPYHKMKFEIAFPTTKQLIMKIEHTNNLLNLLLHNPLVYRYISKLPPNQSDNFVTRIQIPLLLQISYVCIDKVCIDLQKTLRLSLFIKKGRRPKELIEDIFGNIQLVRSNNILTSSAKLQIALNIFEDHKIPFFTIYQKIKNIKRLFK